MSDNSKKDFQFSLSGSLTIQLHHLLIALLAVAAVGFAIHIV